MTPIYVISLRRSGDRRTLISQNMENFNFNFNFIDAEDASEFSRDYINDLIWEPRRVWTNYLRPGAVCCALSHLKAYRNFLNSDYSRCCILEDDAFIDTKNVSRFLSISEDYPDIVLLNSYSIKKIQVYNCKNRSDLFICKDGYPESAAAYLINSRAASAILEYNYPVKSTADQWSEFCKLGLEIGIIKPNIFEIRNMESTIDYFKSPIKKFVPEWLRRIRRKRSYHDRLKNIELIY